MWLGGNSNFEDWSEIGPYVFDGFTALAVLLNDTRPELGQQVRWADSLRSCHLLGMHARGTQLITLTSV